MRKLYQGILSLLLCLFLGSSVTYAQEFQYLPASGFEGQLVKKANYALYYVEEHETAAWVAYELTTNDAFSNTDRTDDFREDPEIRTGSATLEDYRGSGYDRGHQIPAGDAKGSRSDMSETFYLSQMTAQLPNFNRSFMRDMEMMIRGFVSTEKKIYVVTGPVFQDNLGSIGSNEVTIPGYYYKVLLDLTPPIKMIAFLMPHKEGLDKDFTKYVTSVDHVEEITNIDFFPQLEDNIENRLESVSTEGSWGVAKHSSGYSSSHSYDNNSSSSSSTASEDTRCLGIASSTGVRCKKTTTNPSGYCHYHVDQAD